MKKIIITFAVALIAMEFTACALSQAERERDLERTRKWQALMQATFDSLRTVYGQDTIVMMTLGNKTYKTVLIGTQVWMAENLNMEIGNSICYENKKENCNQCGRLYDRETAFKACPKGWHLPSGYELFALQNGGIPPLWDVVENTIDFNPSRDKGLNTFKIKVTGTDLKSKNGWDNNGNGEDTYGFSALPCGALYRESGTEIAARMAGIGNIKTAKFKDYGSIAAFWYVDRQTMNSAPYKKLDSNSDKFEGKEGDILSMFSVRCVQEYPTVKND